MRLGAEALEQCKLFDWIRAHPRIKDVAFHPANERRAKIATGRLLKRMGVLSGVPDVIIPIACGGFHGCFIELKAGKGKLTTNQQAFLDNMTKEGYMAVCCHGADAAIEVITAYLKL